MQIFLLLESLIWLPYGLYLVFDPSFLVVATEGGLQTESPTGVSEIRAMYGGLQAAIGVFCLRGVLRPERAMAALTMLAFLASGLWIGRFCGVLLDGGLSSYTAGALIFEAVTALGAFYFLQRRGSADVSAS